MACSECGAARGHLLGCSIGDAAFLGERPDARSAEVQQLGDRPAPAHNPGDFDDALERRIRLVALPAVLAAVVALHQVGALAFVMKLVAAMWFHECGHAVAAWFTGHLAFPLPWVTPMGERGVLVTLVLAGGLGALAYFSWKQERAVLAVLAGVGASLALVGRLVPETAARTFIDFAGDGLGMVLGATAMLAIFAPPGSRLHHGALRWGLLGLGAVAYVDLFSTWLAAWRDPAEIPFGVQEYAGPSDALRLVESAHWSEAQLVHRYLAVGALCFVGLAAAWAVAQWRARDA